MQYHRKCLKIWHPPMLKITLGPCTWNLMGHMRLKPTNIVNLIYKLTFQLLELKQYYWYICLYFIIVYILCGLEVLIHIENNTNHINYNNHKYLLMQEDKRDWFNFAFMGW